MTEQTQGAIAATTIVAVLGGLVFSIIFGFLGQFLVALLLVGVVTLLTSLWIGAIRSQVNKRRTEAKRGA